MKSYPTKWNDDDFEKMSWHDNCVHAFRIIKPVEGYDYNLVLDLDYILEWIPVNGTFKFVVAPARLTFHSVDEVKFNFAAYFRDNIEINFWDREDITPEPERLRGLMKWRFKIAFHHEQDNALVITTRGFTQELTKQPVTIDRPWLDDSQR